MAVSLIANWFVQLGYYLYTLHTNPLAFRGERTLVDYKTGIIGDVVIVPLMNVCIVYMIRRSRTKLNRRLLTWLVPAGLLADATLHFFQGYLKLTNWSMVRPYQWDFVGYWHMVSFFFQGSLILLFCSLVVRRVYMKNASLMRATYAVYALIALFAVLFMWDYLPLRLWTSHVAAVIHGFIR